MAANVFVHAGQVLVIVLVLPALASVVSWFLSDCLGLFRGGRRLHAPHDWRQLERGDIPSADREHVAQAKRRISRGCAIHTTTEQCTVTSLSEVQR
jgi:hypothetical protein